MSRITTHLPAHHRAPWSAEDDAYLREHYPHRNTRRMAAQLHRSVAAVRQRAIVLGAQKTLAGLRKARGFKPGHRTWIKGLKGVCPGGAKVRKHWFKPGEPNSGGRAKRLPVGSLRKDQANGVWWRKVADVVGGGRRANWKREHVLLWERHVGRVPAGCVVGFRDGNCDRIEIGNLECISRAELMARNTCHAKCAEERSNIRRRATANRKRNRLASAVRCAQLIGALA